MRIILENTETHELRELQDRGSFKRPWRIKETIPDGSGPTNDKMSVQLAVFATKLGLPVPQLLDAARWLLQKDCPYCKLGTQVLRRVSELGEQRSLELINRILAAKQSNDRNTLHEIRREVNG